MFMSVALGTWTALFLEGDETKQNKRRNLLLGQEKLWKPKIYGLIFFFYKVADDWRQKRTRYSSIYQSCPF